jgi:hypothetical protein
MPRRRPHHRAVAGIDPLDLAGDEAVGDVGRAGAAVLLRDRIRDTARSFAQERLLPGIVEAYAEETTDRALFNANRAVAGIDPLDLAGDEAVGDVGRAGAAVLLRDRHAGWRTSSPTTSG